MANGNVKVNIGISIETEA